MVARVLQEKRNARRFGDDWSPMRGFRSPFTEGVTDNYAIGGVSPTVYGDFVGAKNNSVEKYLANGTSTFGNLLTYSGLSPRTMFNSEGNMVWSPHNFFSSNITLAVFSGSVVTTDNAADPNGDLTFDTLTANSVGGTGVVAGIYGSVALASGIVSYAVVTTRPTTRYLFLEWSNIASVPGRCIFDWDDEVITETGAGTLGSEVVDLGGGYKLFRVIWDATGADVTGNGKVGFAINPTGNPINVPRDGTASMTVGAPRANRSFGTSNGMATVPADRRTFSVDDSYIAPTTTTPIFLPRRNAYEYVSGILTRRGLQIETDAGVNLIPGRVSDWNGVVTNLTVTANAAESVTGQTDADSLITTDTAGSLHLARHAITKAASATDYVFAWDVEKSDGGAFDFCIILIHGTSSANRAELDLQFSTGTTQTRTAGSGFTVYDSGSIDMGGGRYRAWMSLQSNADTHLQFQAYVAEGFNDRALDGDGTSGFYVAHCDIKEGRVLSSHIPEGTRAAETIQVKWDSLIGTTPTELTHFMKGSCSYVDSGVTTEVRLLLWQVDGANFQSLVINTGGALTGRYDFDSEESNNNDQSEVTALQLSPGLGVDFAVTASATASRMMTHLNGTAGNPDTGIAALPAVGAEEIRLADFGFVGFIEEWGLYETEIADADQASITS